MKRTDLTERVCEWLVRKLTALVQRVPTLRMRPLSKWLKIGDKKTASSTSILTICCQRDGITALIFLVVDRSGTFLYGNKTR